MRPCFICRSEEPSCGHREPDVILASLAAQRAAWAALTETRSRAEPRKPIEPATGLKTTEEARKQYYASQFPVHMIQRRPMSSERDIYPAQKGINRGARVFHP